MVNLKSLSQKYDAVIFDLGNTLIEQANPGISLDQLTITLRPGVKQLLEEISGVFKIGIVSNTTSISAQDIKDKLATISMEKYFEIIIATSEIGIHKPDPFPIEMAIKKLGVEGSRTLYIGDLASDKKSALAAGASFMYSTPNLYQGFACFTACESSALDRALSTNFAIHSQNYEITLKEFDGLVKPPGSLGILEKLVARISAISHSTLPSVDPAAIAVFVADHGIAADDSVTPWPQSITGSMAELVVGNKAAISILAKNADVYLEVINMGMIGEPVSKLIVNNKIRAGTSDFRFGPAMSRAEALAAMEAGAETAERLIAGGSRFVGVGEIGIGNTTSSAALIAFFTKKPAEQVTGRGSGIDDETLNRKVKIVKNVVSLVPTNSDAIDVLAQIGGFEIAGMVGFILRAASLNIPVLLDGMITLAAALVAVEIKSEIVEFVIASHASSEPASNTVIQHLGLEPILNIGLGIGEGTGAALVIPILRGACLALNEMERISAII
jgi:nicotinate-nucleotide--dimethylbenzimidazole phosphoribosyltransferase